MSTRDLEVARADIGRGARPGTLRRPGSAIQSLLIIPGAPDIKAVMPFWRAVLGYEPRIDSPDEDLVDPHDRGAGFWFEGMDSRGRMVAVRSTGGLGAVRAGAGTHRRRAGRRRPTGARRVRAVVVDACRPGGQRGRHRDDRIRATDSPPTG